MDCCFIGVLKFMYVPQIKYNVKMRRILLKYLTVQLIDSFIAK